MPIIYLGNCYGCAANNLASGFSPGSFGTFAFTREGGQEVPEPAPLSVLGLAMLTFGALRRRQRG